MIKVEVIKTFAPYHVPYEKGTIHQVSQGFFDKWKDNLKKVKSEPKKSDKKDA